MKYERFEDLPVWQMAADLAAKMFAWTQHPSFRGKGDLANQLQRAALSISNNVAEGFERGSTNELINFLYIARGSAGEVRSMLGVMERTPSFRDLKSEIADIKQTCESISRQLCGWADSLQNSAIKGQRHLNDESRVKYDTDKRKAASNEAHQRWRAEFEEKLRSRVLERNTRDESQKLPDEDPDPGGNLRSEI